MQASLLTVPFTNIPLVMSFFTTSIGSLLHPDVQHLLESVLFEPRHYNPSPSPVHSAPVPVDRRYDQLGTTDGVLANEMLLTPDATLRPLLLLLEKAVKLCLGGYTSSFTQLLLFVARTSVRVCQYWLRVQRDDAAVASHVIAQLIEAVAYTLLPKLEALAEGAERAGDKAVQVQISSHVVLCFDLLLRSQSLCPALLSSSTSASLSRPTLLRSGILYAVYIISWHSRAVADCGRSTVVYKAPEAKVYPLLSTLFYYALHPSLLYSFFFHVVQPTFDVEYY